MLALSKARISQLTNLFRPQLTEESDAEYKPQDSEVARSLPLEITFVGPEKSLREFLSTINQLENQYVVIRSIRVSNVKKDPPKASDAKFDSPSSSANPTRSQFGGAFSQDSDTGSLVLPGKDPKTTKTSRNPATAAAGRTASAAAGNATPAPVHKPAPSGRILAQVLGNEEIQVFLRLDLLQFLPAKKLP